MKRFFFSVLAISAIAVGCTKSGMLETPDTYQDPISFEPYTGRAPLTKAISVDNGSALASAGGFQVYAYIHKNGAEATYTETAQYLNKTVTSTDGSNWTYQGYSYWPSTDGGNVLDFLAYGRNANITAPTDYKTISFQVPETIADQTDLLVAAPVVNRTNTNGDTVNLLFSHLLSRISFMLVTTGSNSVPVTIQNLSLTGTFAPAGTVDLTQTSQTTLNLGEDSAESVKARPYITHSSTKSQTYTLLSGETNRSTFTSSNASEGVDISDNGVHWKLTGVKESADENSKYNDAVYVYTPNVQTTTGEDVYQRKDNNGTTQYACKAGDVWYAVTYDETQKTYTMANTTYENADNFEVLVNEAAAGAVQENFSNRFIMIIPTHKETITTTTNGDSSTTSTSSETEELIAHKATLNVTYFLPGAGPTTTAIDLSSIQFLAGKSYLFKLKVSTTTIGFGVEVDIWDPADLGDKQTITLC